MMHEKSNKAINIEDINIGPKIKIEHVNITVKNAFETSKMLEFLFDWKIRWQGSAQLGGHTIHIGDETQYLAIWQPSEENPIKAKFQKGMPLNHIGIETDNLDLIEKRVREFGLSPFNFADYDPGKRFYFFDNDGIEYEIISYNS